MQHLYGKTPGSGEIESPGPVHILGFSGFRSCRFQPIVDFIDLVVRILHEANVKPLGIGDLVRMVEIVDRSAFRGTASRFHCFSKLEAGTGMRDNL
jgi:hypothetical protein